MFFWKQRKKREKTVVVFSNYSSKIILSIIICNSEFSCFRDLNMFAVGFRSQHVGAGKPGGRGHGRVRHATQKLNFHFIIFSLSFSTIHLLPI